MKEKHLCIILFLVFVVVVVTLIYSNYAEGFITSEVPTVEFPFKNLKNQRGENLKIIAITAPFREEKHEQLYKQYKEQGLHFLGISSYLDFPDKIVNPYEDTFHKKQNHNYLKMVSSWVYCTRSPSTNMKNAKIPLLQLTEADMKDTNYYSPDRSIKKEYDFIYVCLDDNKKCEPGWQSYNRNWVLCKECLKVMCSKYNLKGLIVGRINCKITDLCSDKIKFVPFMKFHEFQKTIQKCKFAFVPNITDASPRVITEALCYDMPVLVNENILGGWHNVIPGITGEFFTNEINLKYALDKILNKSYKPRKWFLKHRGENSRKQFADFLKKNYAEALNESNDLTEAYTEK